MTELSRKSADEILKSEYVRVGYIRKPHGLKGFVKVTPLTDFIEERFAAGEKFFLESDLSISLEVEDARILGEDVQLKFFGYDSVESVHGFRGAYLCIPQEDRADPGEDGFYVDELIGMEVFVAGQYLGVVCDVEEYPANPVLIVEGENRDFQVPFIKKAIESVDFESARIVLCEVSYAI